MNRGDRELYVPPGVAPYIALDRRGDCLVVTFNRPDKHNAFPDEAHDDLPLFFASLAYDPSRVIVFTGAGRSFCAGGDIGGVLERSEEQVIGVIGDATRIVTRLLEVPQVTVAKVNGAAIGLGAVFALACDLAYASSRAKFSDPHIDLGVVPGDGAGMLIMELMGPMRGREVLLTGRPVSATEAAEAGLITRVVDPERLDEEVDDVVATLLSKPPIALRLTKQLLVAELRGRFETLMTMGMGQEGITMQTSEYDGLIRRWVGGK
jgi:enoyl-CoA hydratase